MQQVLASQKQPRAFAVIDNDNTDLLLIKVTITDKSGAIIRRYVMDHNDPAQRSVLGQQCRLAFEAGQTVQTVPLNG